MQVTWWMPSSFIVPPEEILACSNIIRSGADRAGAAEDAKPVPPGVRSGPAGAVAEDTCGLLDAEAGVVDCLDEAAAVEDEPLERAAARVEARERRRQQRERQAHGVEQQQVAATDRADRGERPQRV